MSLRTQLSQMPSYPIRCSVCQISRISLRYNTLPSSRPLLTGSRYRFKSNSLTKSQIIHNLMLRVQISSVRKVKRHQNMPSPQPSTKIRLSSNLFRLLSISMSVCSRKLRSMKSRSYTSSSNRLPIMLLGSS